MQTKTHDSIESVNPLVLVVGGDLARVNGSPPLRALFEMWITPTNILVLKLASYSSFSTQ